MAMPLQVDLPVAQVPAWPAGRCVRCFERDGDRRWSVRADSFSLWGLATDLLHVGHWFGRGRRFQVPMCGECVDVEGRRSTVFAVTELALMSSAMLGAVYLAPADWGVLARLGLFAGSVVLGCLPLIYWHMRSPGAILVSDGPHIAEFEFRNARYAEAFAQLNESVVEQL